MVATLNDLEVKLDDILNPYVQAPVTEKVWATLSPEFGKDPSKTTMIVRNFTVLSEANYGCIFKLPNKAENKFGMGYSPELDTSQKLEPDVASYYLTIIGILRWMIKLERIDIITEISLSSSHAAIPRKKHLDAAVHVMAHVGQRYNSRLVCDPL